MNQKNKMAFSILAFLGVILLTCIDQFTKFLAVKHLKDAPYEVIPGIFEFHYLENSGTAFGMMQGKQVLLLLVTIMVLILALIYFVKLPWTKQMNFLRILSVFVISGGIGNMIDRLRVHYVIDFLYFKMINFPIFNVADIYVTCATFALAFLIIFYYKEDEIDAIFHIFKKRM